MHQRMNSVLQTKPLYINEFLTHICKKKLKMWHPICRPGRNQFSPTLLLRKELNMNTLLIIIELCLLCIRKELYRLLEFLNLIFWIIIIFSLRNLRKIRRLNRIILEAPASSFIYIYWFRIEPINQFLSLVINILKS